VSAPEQKTLYRADLSDPRQRTADPRDAARARTVRRAERTSDTTRFTAALAAALAAATAAAVTALAFPPPGGHAAPGPLSRPHVKAGLACTSCHKSDEKTVAADACAGCHGPHGSVRPGHTKALAARAMRCSTCHPIHQGDQGVAFVPGKPPVRFAPGVEVEVEPTGFVPPQPATVPIVTLGPCKSCHAVADPQDPIARCIAPGQEALGDARPIACFDEHEVAHPDDSLPGGNARDRGPRAPGAPNTRTGGVCAGQHTTDRAAVWAAAREIAVRVPVAEARKAAGLPWLWFGSGLFTFALVFGGARGGRWLAARLRSRKAAAVPTALLKPAVRKRLPTINTSTCIGCYACVDACPYDVLEVERYVAVVARPEACCGLVLCEQRCPNGSLTISDGEAIGDRPRLSDDLESPDTPGLFLAGDITGLPLIKNAILQGAHAVSRIAEIAKKSPAPAGNRLDLIIIGAGPAGISAALRAKELGLSYEVVEQGTVAQSIQSFPRGKLVFDQPLDLPVAGKLWLKESTKEELLSQWLRIIRKEQLTIFADTRMTSVKKRDDGGFTVMTQPREGGPPTERRARFVLLAIGQRGTPRRLPIELAPEVEDRIHYHMADARSFAGKRVLVSGLGDVAMETAVALSRQPDTTVSIVHRGEDFSRGQGRNIQAVKRLVTEGKIALYFRAEIADVAPRHAVVRVSGPAPRTEHLAYDAIFVMIGSIPPWNTLRPAGVRTVAEGEPGSILKTLLSPGVAPPPPAQ
jgi:thioredoxin reductase/NAD-dependent dihydropyrimidine dehydrogenase PreA subunit